MCKSAPKGSISVWAWMASIAAHTLLLAGLALVQFSPPRHLPAIKQTPAARITRIKEIAQSPFVMPKPKVKRPPTQLLRPVPDRLPAQTGTAPPNRTAAGLACLAAKTSGASSTLPHSGIPPAEIDFFGSAVSPRKVCFLVDCSGSMHGMFRQVAERLKSTIMGLRPDQYFYIILFGRGKLIESGDGRLIRATHRAKLEACDFIDRAAPGGRTNTLTALKRAMEIQDSRGHRPAVIFFLTDGFELLPEDKHLLLRKLAAMRKRVSPETRINTIGFWAQPADCAILRAIAGESGGRFNYVEP